MSLSPAAQAKAATPAWFFKICDFNGLELHPCRVEYDRRGTPFTVQCEPAAAEFWSVFGHCKSGGAECLDDFATEQQGRDFASKLLAAWPHLGEFGLWG